MFQYEKWEENANKYITQIVGVEQLKNSRILVTGSTGLIGSAILDILIYLNERCNFQIAIYAAARHETSVFHRFPQFIDKEYFHFISYDASAQISFDFEVDYIIQGASNADPMAISSHPSETLISNVYGMQQVLNYARKIPVKGILYISSSEVYGSNLTGKPFRECDYGAVDILNPRASYPMGKRAAETLCSCYAAEYGMHITMVRPGHIYGPTITSQDSRATAQFTRKALAKEDIVMKSAGEQLRSYCYVYDCVSAILTVLIVGKSGNAYNISNKDSIVSIRRMAELFAEKGGVSIRFEVPDNSEKASYNLMDMSALDASSLEALGWCALENDETGVDLTLELFEND